ncbi:inorganic phosphate transporter [Fundidesulfovibrio terrae]|uniref:inorganic phosphate transporter n=1 Tax=Fundidesulfovibrio terrae TaxID=2922866 RepID=UPI001FAFDBF1|nr:inorganic phosphate transporter [Fundidesulfovibrio terrae]
MPEIPLLLIVIVVVALVFDFTNGAHDSANAIATVVSTKVLSPRTAVLMAAALDLFGAFLGTEVAQTVGSGIVGPDVVAGCKILVLAALFGAICWNVLTWYLGIPSSSSHALIGGLVGATIAYKGWDAPSYASIIKKVVVPLLASPVAGFLMGYFLMVLLSWLFVKAHPRTVNTAFKKLQILSSAVMATSHGLNDAQKTMGVITLALVIFKIQPDVSIPVWVKIACATAMALGTASGGWKIVKTMGHKIFKLEPVHGFAAETAAAAVIMSASAMGAPISTTHTISTTVIGVGASKRFSAVRWGVAGNLVIAWVLTIPASACVGALCFWALELMGLGG